MTGAGTVIIPGGPARTTSGIGDVVAGLTYTVDFGDAGLYLDLTAKAKIPTASVTKGLGTGKADFIGVVTVTKEIGNFSIYGEGRRRFAGKPVGSRIRDTWGASTGVSTALGRGVNLSVDYDWQQSSFAGGSPSSEISATTTFRLTPSLRMQVYAGTGFNSSSVDASAGITLLWRFDQR